MTEPVFGATPEARKFVEDTLKGANPNVQVSGGILNGRYGKSPYRQFLELRQQCATGTAPTGVNDPAEVCGLVLEKTVEAAKAGASVTDARHPLALFINAMDYKKYTDVFGGGDMPPEVAGELGAALYAAGSKNNKATTTPLTFSYDNNPSVWPAGSKQSPTYTNFKGMAYDAAYTKGMVDYIKTGKASAEVFGAVGFLNPADLKLASTKCHVSNPNIPYQDCYEAGLRQADEHIKKISGLKR